MRLLAFTSRDIRHPRFAGGDVYLFELLSMAARKGHEVHMVCSDFHGLGSRDLVGGIHVRRVKHRAGLARMLHNYALYKREYQGRVDLVFEEAEGPQGPFLARAFVKEPIALVWHQLGRKIFVGQFGPLVGRLLSGLDYLYAFMYRNALIVTPSYDRAAEISSFTKNANTITIHPAVSDFNALPTSIEKTKITRRCEGLYLLTIGKFRRYKRLDHPLRAFKLVSDEFPQAKLVIGGIREDMKYERELSFLASKLGKGKAFVYPNLTGPEKADLLKGAYAFIMPSPIEGFSISTLEALAVGVPAIATEGVPSELVKDRLNGLRYPYGDLAKLAEQCSYLLAHQEIRDNMSIVARQIAQGFSWENSYHKLLPRLEQLARERVSQGRRSKWRQGKES